ncbi:response regulator containing a CheY-like receiver domain and an HTH DNA-binding domain [Leptolyngbyaceae cyanobacterium JSC-12]|nr:response regulator containing a CheY-like receiver domain and an HTH DNA-binding domain [Leptolyngbyaceae cyanobacterium JSC-12]
MISQSPATLNVMLIDSDSQFRQELADRLAPYSDVQLVLEADSDRAALRGLQQWFDQHPTETMGKIPLDLIILSLDLPPDTAIAIALCRDLRRQYPNLPILTISTVADPVLLSAAFQAGALGYCRKDTVIADLVLAMRQVAAGYPFWVQGMESVAQAFASATTSQPMVDAPSLLGRVRRNLRQSGLAQIDAAIAQINAQLADPNLTLLDQLFLTGRRRELRASRWLIKRLLTTSEERSGFSSAVPPVASSPLTSPLPVSPLPPRVAPPAEAPIEPIVLQPESTALRNIQASLFDTTFAKLQLGVRNLTDVPLEIDILREDRKRELLTLVLRKLEEVLAELRFSQMEFTQLANKQSLILEDVWRATTTDFFGRYYTLPLGDSPSDRLMQPPVEMVSVLLQDSDVVQAEILSKIPMVTDFLAHLLFQVPLMVDETTYAVGTVEAMTRMEALLQNLIIQVGNAVIQPLLNRFGNVVAVKQNFYDRRLLSTREIERFRNNLSWKYRINRYFKEPTAIFESRYNLFVFGELGIVKTSVYSPRNQELDELSGVGLAVTLALEARDAIAPRLRSAISFVGSGVVYILTEVIGRGIGLIGRGIIKGVGNVVQDTKFSRNTQRWR